MSTCFPFSRDPWQALPKPMHMLLFSRLFSDNEKCHGQKPLFRIQRLQFSPSWTHIWKQIFENYTLSLSSPYVNVIWVSATVTWASHPNQALSVLRWPCSFPRRTELRGLGKGRLLMS